MISRKVKELGQSIRPALAADQVLYSLQGNAIQWGIITKQLLIEHYEKTLANIQDNLVTDEQIEDWPEALTVARRWSKKNLPRITETTLRQAENEIANCFHIVSEEEQDRQSEVSESEEEPAVTVTRTSPGGGQGAEQGGSVREEEVSRVATGATPRTPVFVRARLIPLTQRASAK